MDAFVSSASPPEFPAPQIEEFLQNIDLSDSFNATCLTRSRLPDQPFCPIGSLPFQEFPSLIVPVSAQVVCESRVEIKEKVQETWRTFQASYKLF